MDRLIQMIINQVLRHVIRRGLDNSINHISGRSKPTKGIPDAYALARKARQAANIARRLGR